MEDECCFKLKFDCGERNEEVRNAGPAHVKMTIKFSKEYGEQRIRWDSY